MHRGLALEDLASTKVHCCCAYGNIVLTRSLHAPDSEYIVEWANGIIGYARTHPQGLGLLNLIDANAQPPTENERVVIRNGFMKLRPVVRGAVLVVEGQGFIAAAMRGALTLINLRATYGYPVKVAGDIAEATPQLVKMLGSAMDTRVDTVGLEQAAREVKAKLER